jgi:hypothetical protein
MKWTTAILTAVVIPTIAVAQDPTYGRDTARAQGRDTARAQAQRRNQPRDPQVRAESRGNVEMSRRGARSRTTWGLSSSQIRELQQSLQGIDCYDAEIDGLIGPRTRAGIACAMRHHDITGQNPNELLRALGLTFEVDANAGLGAVMRSGAANRDQREPRTPARDRQRDTTGRAGRDTLQGNRPTTPPPPENVPPR